MAIFPDKIRGKKSSKSDSNFYQNHVNKTKPQNRYLPFMDTFPILHDCRALWQIRKCCIHSSQHSTKNKRKWECLRRARTSILLLLLKFEHCLLSYADSWRQSLCFNPAKLPTFSAVSALLAETQNSLIVIPHLVRWTKNLLTDISLSVKKMQFTQNIDTLLKWEHMLIIMWSLLEIIDNREAIIFNVLLRLWNDNHCTKGPKMIDGLSFGAYTWHKLLYIYFFFFFLARRRQSGIANIQLSCFLKKA